MLAAANSLSGQSTIDRLRAEWVQGNWEAVSSAANTLLTEQPGHELARFAAQASAMMRHEFREARGLEFPVDLSEWGEAWELEATFMEGVFCQLQGNYPAAEASFSHFIQGADADHLWWKESQLRREQCAAHRGEFREWTPVCPLEVQTSAGPQAFHLPDSIGRWVALPRVLQSHHDLRAGRAGEMFIQPLASRAYFASDRAGNGTTDLYEVDVKADGTFGKIRRLPEPINSSYNEITPVFDPTSGMIYWSSDRPISWGGMDVFSAQLAAPESTTALLPLGYNSPGNETHFTPSGDGWTAWMTTSRWEVADRAAIRLVSDGPVRHPIRVDLDWEFSDAWSAGTHLAIWCIDSDVLVWEGPLNGSQGNCSWVGADGATYRALITQSGNSDYTSTEWTLPTSAEPMICSFGWSSLFGSPWQRSEAPWSGPECLEPHWTAMQPSAGQQRIPSHPIGTLDLPVEWGALAASTWWHQATTSERWVAVRALHALNHSLELPEEPEANGWENVLAGLQWNAETWAPLVERIQQLTQALDLICSAEDSEGWEDVCAQWTEGITEDQSLLERAVVWHQLAETTKEFNRLRLNLPPHLKLKLNEVSWFADAGFILAQAVDGAFNADSWDAMVGTEEVWRDWLWAVWQAHRSGVDEEGPALLEAWWNLERAFDQPLWANLAPAAHALADLILGIEPVPSSPVVLAELEPHSIPAESRVPEEPVQSPLVDASISSLQAIPDSVFVVQLGAFHEVPDGWAYFGIREGLKLRHSSGWNKVIYGAFNDLNSARSKCLEIRQLPGFEDAFVSVLSATEFESLPAWHDHRLAGYGVRLTLDRTELEWLIQQYPGKVHVWQEREGIDALVGPFWSASAVQQATGQIQLHSTTIAAFAFPSGTPLPSQPEQRERASQQPAPVPAEPDASRWVIRIAEFPLGAPPEVRAALLRLPDAYRVRALAWGSGDAYVTGEIVGAAAAKQVVEDLHRQGFNEARLLSMESN